MRLTVASSIHELAVILGEDLATKDLVPVFNGFIKDLDEVRIGALRHLAEFLKVYHIFHFGSVYQYSSRFFFSVFINYWLLIILCAYDAFSFSYLAVFFLIRKFDCPLFHVMFNDTASNLDCIVL